MDLAGLEYVTQVGTLTRICPALTIRCSSAAAPLLPLLLPMPSRSCRHHCCMPAERACARLPQPQIGNPNRTPDISTWRLLLLAFSHSLFHLLPRSHQTNLPIDKPQKPDIPKFGPTPCRVFIFGCHCRAEVPAMVVYNQQSISARLLRPPRLVKEVAGPLRAWALACVRAHVCRGASRAVGTACPLLMYCCMGRSQHRLECRCARDAAVTCTNWWCSSDGSALWWAQSKIINAMKPCWPNPALPICLDDPREVVAYKVFGPLPLVKRWSALLVNSVKPCQGHGSNCAVSVVKAAYLVPCLAT